jgi:hypothetical protein
VNEYLSLTSGNELLLIEPADGKETFAKARDVFTYVDSNFTRWGCNSPGKQTPQTAVRVYEMARDGTFAELFKSFHLEIVRLCLTQAQIINFVRRHPNWLKSGGNGTFLLFEVEQEFFVAAVYQFFDGRIGVRARRFSLDRVFRARKRHRLVVPGGAGRPLS